MIPQLNIANRFNYLNSSEYNVFIEKPPEILINNKGLTKYANSAKIEILIAELKEKGCLLAIGSLGPNSYTASPIRLAEQVCGQDIYSWTRSTLHINGYFSRVLILGAKKMINEEYVYFTLADYTDGGYPIQTYKPSEVDEKIYRLSHTKFLNYLNDLYPNCSSEERMSINFLI